MVIDGYAPRDSSAIASAARKAMGAPLHRPLARALRSLSNLHICPSTEVFCGLRRSMATYNKAMLKVDFFSSLAAVRSFPSACDLARSRSKTRASSAKSCNFDGSLTFIYGAPMPIHPLPIG